MENDGFVDQNLDVLFFRVVQLVESRPDIFSLQGSVVEGWRQYRGRRLGPYFRLVYREERRQKSIYLGRSVTLADRVRQYLQAIQITHRDKKSYARIRQQIRRSLREQKAKWEKDLAGLGLWAKGFEVRSSNPAVRRKPASTKDAVRKRSS